MRPFTDHLAMDTVGGLVRALPDRLPAKPVSERPQPGQPAEALKDGQSLHPLAARKCPT